jgi:hypothetical protein
MHRLARPVHTVRLQHIANALLASGHTSLDEQAKALGLRRSTAWTIVRAKHKLGRLSTKTTERILANRLTPPSVRALLQLYLAEMSDALSSRARRLDQREWLKQRKAAAAAR